MAAARRRRGPKRSAASLSASQWSRIGIGAAIALSLAWLAVRVGTANAFAGSAPAAILAWQPEEARAQASLATQQILADQSPANLRSAVLLARAALIREPTLASAYGVLANGEPRDARSLQRLLNASEALSKRDLLTRLALIEQAVADDDVGRVVGHYDVALRTSRLAPSMLYPILYSAIEDGQIRRALVPVLVARPAWAHPFLAEAMQKAPSLDALAELVQMLSERPGAISTELAPLLAQRAITDNRYDVVERVTGVRLGSQREIGDERFRRANQTGPFEWQLSEDPRVAIAPSQQGLSFEVQQGPEVVLVRRLLFVAPGSYRLLSRGSATGRLRWGLSCGGKRAGDVANVPLGHDTTVIIPSDCQPQRLSLMQGDIADTEISRGDVEFIRLEREPS